MEMTGTLRYDSHGLFLETQNGERHRVFQPGTVKAGQVREQVAVRLSQGEVLIRTPDAKQAKANLDLVETMYADDCDRLIGLIFRYQMGKQAGIAQIAGFSNPHGSDLKSIMVDIETDNCSYGFHFTAGDLMQMPPLDFISIEPTTGRKGRKEMLKILEDNTPDHH